MILAPLVNSSGGSSEVDSSSWAAAAAAAIMSSPTTGSSVENVSSYYDDVIASTMTSGGGGGGTARTTAALDYDDLPMDMRFNDSHVIGISVYSCLMIISAIGNTTVLRLLLRRKSNSSRPRINWMLIHLAIADLLVTFLMMPMEIGWLWTVSWVAGDAMCRIMSFFRMFGLCLSSNILICISVDRYHAVKRPLSMLDVDKRGKWMLIVAWCVSFACSAPQSIVFHVEAHPDYPWYEQCVTFNTFSSVTHERIYAVFGMITMYWIPFIVIIYTYTSIIVEMYKRSRSTTTGIRRSSLGFLGRARVRTLKMTIIIVLVFFVCWTPYYVMSLWYWIDHRTAKNVDQRIQKALFLFACTNSCMNPIVYGAFNIRKGNKDLSSSQRRMTCSSRGSGGSGGAQDQVSTCRIVTWPHHHHHHNHHQNSYHHQQHRRRDSSSTRSSGSGRRVRLVPAEITILPSGRYETTTTITLALDDMNSRLIVTEKKNNNISIL